MIHEEYEIKDVEDVVNGNLATVDNSGIITDKDD